MATSIPQAEVDARPLRPVATWVRMPDETGRLRLTQIWTVPDPLALHAAQAVREAG